MIFAMKAMIITADDYGMCGIVDAAIDSCIESGIVSSTNVIVNMQDLESVKSLRSRFPHISIGMHWNITAGRPISPTVAIPSLVDENGDFYKLSVFLRRYKQGLVKKKDIKCELCAQYEVFRSLCGKADYWNTHQNSSLSIGTFGIFNRTALELGIDRTRTFRRTYVKDKRLSAGQAIVEVFKRSFLDMWFGYVIPQTGTKLPDGRIFYFDDNQKTESIKNIGENIEWGNKQIVELVVHPAISPSHPFFGTLTDMRVKEWKMFSSKDTLKYLNDNGIEVVTFEELNESKRF